MELTYDSGTIVLRRTNARSLPQRLRTMRWDPRVEAWRAPASDYARVLDELRVRRVRGRDRLREAWAGRVELAEPALRPYQQAALAAWWAGQRRGVVQLPTGSGKTRVAVAALARLGRPALVLVPTRVLLQQWVRVLRAAGVAAVGRVGDGEREVEDVTVATLESAVRHGGGFLDRFGLLIVDEVHQAVQRRWSEALATCPAPARLGLTATPPEESAARARLELLIGPLRASRRIDELQPRALAPLRHVVSEVSLTDEELLRYRRGWEPWRAAMAALRAERLGASASELVRELTASERGRELLAGRRAAAAVVARCRAKFELALELLGRCRGERVLIFTADTAAALALSEAALVPALTADLTGREREATLSAFGAGELGALISCRVLNEGVDVPEASVAIVLGGALGRREHAQRLGRILRPGPGKQAVLHEIVVRGTFEHARRIEREVAVAAARPAHRHARG